MFIFTYVCGAIVKTLDIKSKGLTLSFDEMYENYFRFLIAYFFIVINLLFFGDPSLFFNMLMLMFSFLFKPCPSGTYTIMVLHSLLFCDLP